MPQYTPQSGIYVIINIKNDKVYIGKANDIRARWRHHRHELNHDHHCNIHLQHAWNKYGAHCFKFKVLEYCDVDQLEEREKHHISIYKAKELAYNITDGGTGGLGLIPNKETRDKMRVAQLGSKRNLGRTLTEEHKQKISKSLKGKKRGKLTEAHKRKISESRKGKPIKKRTAEHSLHISESKMGHPVSEETRQKLRDAANAYYAKKKGDTIS